MPQARTFFEKVWNDHVIADLGDETFLLQIDRLFLHELSGSEALRRLERSGRAPQCPELVFAVIDHVVDTVPGRGDETRIPGGAERIRATRSAARRYGLHFFDVGDDRQGIVHVVSPELGVALPGLTLVCGDSHTCTVGGIGALAFGIGSSEVEHVLATQTLPQVKPKTMRVRFEGRCAAGVVAKDLILALIGRIGANGGIGHAVEFAGSAVRALPVDGRLTLCNMAIEFSAKYGFVAPDDVTYDYLAGREFAPKGAAWERALSYWRTLPGDPDAAFDAEVEIDCTVLAPQITWGTSPEHTVPVDGRVPDPATAPDAVRREAWSRAAAYTGLTPGTPLEGVPITAAFIGSCTNSRLSDLRAAAEVLRGRKVAAGVRAICVPGSTRVKREAEAEGLDRVFTEAGFEWRESGCSLCAFMGGETFAGERVVSTTNRNFEGRQGPGARTHLASPATVAASAVAGSIADARKMAH